FSDVSKYLYKLQKRPTRPISKVLNPLARSGGYSMAVALSFTQTKMNMPATKQSSISAFFLPKSKTSEDTEECSSSPLSEVSSPPLPELHTGTKRKHAATTESPLEPHTETGCISVVHPQPHLERESAEVCKDPKGQDFFQLIWGYQSEEHEPAEKRRPPEDLTVENGTETQTDSNPIHRWRTTDEVQDIPETLLDRDQEQPDSHCHPLHRSNVRVNGGDYSAALSAEDLQCQENLRVCAVKDKNVSNQMPVLSTRSATEKQHTTKPPSESYKELDLSEQKHNYTQLSHVKRRNKENAGLAALTHNTDVNWLLSTSPARHFSNVQKQSVYQSPKKSARGSVENERDSFAMLFTQDSEGFRVIANRNKQTRCALKDRTNSTEGRDDWNLTPVKALEMEEDSQVEPEMLFTQDSQGNMVIRH
ncbi:hypothetical protein NFI96_018987, partial [Prochilodus magdalenae]